MSFEDWKAQVALALERECWWDPGEGEKYMDENAGPGWRELYDDGVSPDEAAFFEHASILAAD